MFETLLIWFLAVFVLGPILWLVAKIIRVLWQNHLSRQAIEARRARITAQLARDDAFAASMAEWGYIGERRGGEQ